MRTQTLVASLYLVVCGGCGGDSDSDPSASSVSGAGTQGDAGSGGASGTGAMDASSAAGTGGGMATGDDTSDSADESGESTGGDVDPPPTGMPAGIPMPAFGYLYDTAVPPTIFVDNTDPGCDNAQGTADAPLCDLFAGGDAGTWNAGDVVTILGGPYLIDGDKALNFAGTADNPVIIRAAGDTVVRFDAQGQRADFVYDGQYAIVENIDFFHMTRHTVASEASYLVFRGIEVHNPEGAFIDFNPVFNVTGDNIIIHESMIYDNRRTNDTDSHGIQAGAGASNLWILDNEIYNNNGDAFQGCHLCFDNPPDHVYIGRNVLHEDRENGVDLKTIHDVVISENLMYGYTPSQTSGGDAMVIGSNGYDMSMGQGPARVWVLNNEFRDSGTGIRVEGVEDVWIIGNVFTSLGTGLQVDNTQFRDIVVASNVIDGVEAGIFSWNGSCSADSLVLENNIIGNVSGFHIEMPECGNLTLANNLLWGGASVRIGGQIWNDAASLDAAPFASGHLDVDPQFEANSVRPGAASPAVDAGVSLEAYHAAVEAAYGGDARKDLTGALRPGGAAADIGAYER